MNHMLKVGLTAVVVYLLVWAVGVPLWARFAALALVLLLGLLLSRLKPAVQMSMPVSAVFDSTPPPAEAPQPIPQSSRVALVALPTRLTDYRFAFSAIVHWAVAEEHNQQFSNAGNVAKEIVLERARAFAATQEPEDYDFAAHILAARLGDPVADRSGRVRVWASDIHLKLLDDDSDHLRKRRDQQRSTRQWEIDRRHEQEVRAYLQQDMLANPGNAAAWWLANHDHDVEKCVDMLGTLAKLSDAATNRLALDLSPQAEQFAGPPDAEPTVEQAVAVLVRETHDDYRRIFAASLANLEKKFGRPDLAAQISSRYGVDSLAEVTESVPANDLPSAAPPPSQEDQAVGRALGSEQPGAGGQPAPTGESSPLGPLTDESMRVEPRTTESD